MIKRGAISRNKKRGKLGKLFERMWDFPQRKT